MNKFIINLGIIGICITLAGGVHAQTDRQTTQTAKPAPTPIFINPYKPTLPTYESDTPNLVRSTGNNTYSQYERRYTKPNKTSGPVYDEVFNPYGPGYGRIRGEKDFYDTADGRYYKQYEYMTLLAKRGDVAKLQSVVQDVQQNGVFDPEKYKAAIAAATGVNTDNPGGGSSGIPGVAPMPKKQVYVNKNDTPATPQKLHRGYDDEPAQKNQQPRQNQPIFLR